MKTKGTGTGTREPRKDRILHWLGFEKEYYHDTYKAAGKLPEPTVCPECGALFHGGRWTWGAKPAQAHKHTCPACRRIQDKYPAGILQLSGPFIKTHREEVLNAARHQEETARKEHPLCRIIDIQESEEEVAITTTDVPLPRRIGEALWHAYHGELKLHYAENEKLIRMTWRR